MIEITDSILEMPPAEELELADLLHALSDPIRLRIVEELAARGEQACGAVPLPVSASTRSHHFKILREAGLTERVMIGGQAHQLLRLDAVERALPGVLPAVVAAAGA
jgi:DNA-binding transcriptional ArsR family regulator